MESVPEIQALGPDDLEPAAIMLAGLEFFRSYGYGRDHFRQKLESAREDARSVLIAAKRGGQVAGLAWLVPRAGFDRSSYLRLLAVSAAEQRRGLGGKLLSHLELGHLEPNGIFLLVTEDNLPARAFYRRQGYRQTGRLTDYVRPGRVECIFYKAATR